MKSTNFKLNQSQRKSRKKLFIITALIIAALVGVGGILYVRRADYNKQPPVDDAAQTSSAKKDVIENDKSRSKIDGLPANSTDITSDQVPTSSEVKIANLDYNQTGDNIMVSATIEGGSSAGTCVFSFKSPDEKPIVKQTESSAAQCMTTVSKFEFSKLGTWNLSVIRYQGDTKVEAERDVTVN